MNPKLDYVNLSRYETVFEIPCECSFDADMVMPDYCPEIKKILKSSINVNNISVQTSSDSVTVYADAILRIIYVSDNGEISAYEHMNKIEKKIDASVPGDSFVNASIITDYINTRAVNQRKIESKVMTTVKVKAMRKRVEQVLSSAECEGLQSFSNQFVFSSISGMGEKIFALSETVEIDKNKSEIKRILNSYAYTCVNDLKVINNKVLIKGNCQVIIHYISNSASAVECVEYSLPISQIAEVDGISEKSKINHCVNVICCEAVPRVDAAGEMRLVDLNLKLSALITGYENQEISLINDCYSIVDKIETVRKKTEIFEINDSVDTTFLNKVVFESIGVSLSSVLAVWCSDLKYSFILSGKNCMLSGTYNAVIIYIDSEKQIGIIQKPVDFENIINLKSDAERIVVNGNAQLLGCACSITGDSRIELKSEISVNCTVLSSRNVDYVSDVVFNESNEKNEQFYALTLYYCNAGESLWDIAKRYNTTVEAIKKENSIDGESVNSSSMLLIPGC